MPASVSALMRASKKAVTRSKISAGGTSVRTATPRSCTMCITISLALRLRQLGIERGIGKAVNVVEIVDALRQAPSAAPRCEKLSMESERPFAFSAGTTAASRAISTSGATAPRRDWTTPRRYR